MIIIKKIDFTEPHWYTSLNHTSGYTKNLTGIKLLKEAVQHMGAALEIRNLHAQIEDKPILRGVNLTINQGEVHALMGPNGSGKSTLANVLLGNPAYEVTEGEILFNGDSVLEMEPDERARAGLFLAFQYPVSIPGVTVANFLRLAINARMKAVDPESKGISVSDFRRLLKSKMDMLQMDHSFAGRYLNEGFSGGEKKRAEILQMATLEPTISILDETDSGLDIDALRVVSEGVNKLRGPGLGVLVITHYQRILNYIQPEYVHIMYQGRIVESGGADLAHKLEQSGYDFIRERFGSEETETA
jgi:Fe-S cluster assembly ATP-binding protein